MKSIVTSLYLSVVSLRNWCFEQSLLATKKVNAPVVSVGNITAGGTGKTPVVDYFLKWSEARGIRAGVVSRGYGGSYSGVQKVALDFNPEIYGDEPTMLALNNPKNPIYVGKDRVRAAQELMANEKVDIIFADDCFQHRRLYRDLDIVIVDLLEETSQYTLLPFGRGREPLCGLKRADAIIFNKRNLASTIEREERESFIKNFTEPETLWIYSDYLFGGIRSIFDGNIQAKQETYLLVSGIGNPVSFEKITSENDCQFSQHFHFRDHYKYSEKDILEIENKAKGLGVNHILTTNKDAVKLRRLVNKTELTWSYVDLKIEMKGVDDLYEKIICLLA